MNLGKELDEFVSTNQPKELSLSLFKKLRNAIPKLQKEERLIGEGNHGKVYRINNRFVVKVIPENAETYSHASLPKDIKLQTYYGRPVIDLGNIKILYNAAVSENPICAGVPKHLAYTDKMFYCRNVTLPKFAELPQKAYDKLAEDFAILRQANRSFDTINPNNFIADGNEIKVVDELEYPDINFKNSLAGMLKAMINKYDVHNRAEFDAFAVGPRRTIIEKIFIAGEKANLPYGNSTEEIVEIEKALILGNIYVPWSEIQKDLKQIRKMYPKIEDRVLKISEYFQNIDQLNFEYFIR